MKKITFPLVLVFMLLSVIFLVSNAFAVPTFQTYIEGAVADSIVQDAQTWFSSANPFNLIVVGAYGPRTTTISNVTLLISVPEGETGTIDFDVLNEGNTILKTAGTNPTANANINILTNIATPNGYSTKNFLPVGMNYNEHDPVKDDLSDFLLFDLGSFTGPGAIHNYDAETGNITEEGTGVEKTYAVTYDGFSRLHFDVYGLVTNTQGNPSNPNYVSNWDNNPGSHDSTATGGNGTIPEPASLSLLGLGLLGLLARFKPRNAK